MTAFLAEISSQQSSQPYTFAQSVHSCGHSCVQHPTLGYTFPFTVAASWQCVPIPSKLLGGTHSDPKQSSPLYIPDHSSLLSCTFASTTTSFSVHCRHSHGVLLKHSCPQQPPVACILILQIGFLPFGLMCTRQMQKLIQYHSSPCC